LGSSPAKKIDPSSLDSIELPNDRELGLSKNFEDPVLSDLIPGLSENPKGIVREAAEAVHELLLDSQKSPADVVDLLGGDMAGRLFQLVASDRSFEDLVSNVLDAIMSAVSASAGSILEFDHASNEFFFRASTGGGDPSQLKGFRVPANKGIVGHVAESRAALLLADLEEDQRQLKAISLSVGFEATSCLALPVIVGGQLYGVIELFNRQDGSSFNQRDLEAARQGAAMAAKVLEVRFLMAELARRMR
jgi:transcriptional regulator with GAF, ATPase, and Fis domain